MKFDFNNIQFDYNSKVILTYLFICLGAWFLNVITRGKTNKLFFENYRSSPLNPLTYIRLFTHAIGHQDLDHLIRNFLYILLVGPMIEEKYGSTNLIIMFLITSLVIALFNIIFTKYTVLGASGNVYMLIVLSSFTNISEGKIPLTVIMILIFYILGEIKGSLLDKSKVYHDGHLIGALCGLLFGIYFLYFKSFPFF
ncbi:MAG: rhomboid family intramembrane serine protease [Bacilli bacterium]|nr:rhomboid family intramembrane serine protease [Bacilli bacterium]